MTDFSNIRYEALDSHDCCENQPVASAFVQHETVEWSPSRIHVKAESGAFPAAESSKSSFGGARRGISYNKSGVPRETRARQQTWTVVYKDGQTTSTFRTDKRGIIQKFRLGIPIRDMRLLDPALLTSETGKILIRDNAIVFSMEHVRLIITADEVIYPELTHNALASHFTGHLAVALKEAAEQAHQMEVLQEEMSDVSDGSRHEVAALPFELQVLEVALRDVSELATRLSKELEAIAHPALDTLTKQVNTTNLERVRKVKTRHQRLLTRVQTIREELQRFLEDDDDMAKLCLTRKQDLERAAGSTGAGPHTANSLQHAGSMNRRTSMSLSRGSQLLGESPHALQQDSPRAPPLVSLQQVEDESESIDAVENLLESYFMQVDSAYDRLVSVGEYIKDTEEYINIELDSSRNRLIRLEIVLTAGTFAVGIFACIAGILGENLVIPEAITKNLMGFISVNTITFAVCLLCFVGIMGYIRWRRLL